MANTAGHPHNGEPHMRTLIGITLAVIDEHWRGLRDALAVLVIIGAAGGIVERLA